jgi:hypothetical protein
MQQSIAIQISNYTQGRVFTPADFSNIASRDNIDQTLSRLKRAGYIRRLQHGLYDKPVLNGRFGTLPPDIDKAAHAYMSKFGYKLQVHPAKAAHLLGLSDQVPSSYSYLTDGRNKTMVIGNTKVSFKHASARKMIGIGTKAGLVVQALYYFGMDYFGQYANNDQNCDNTLRKIKSQLNSKDIHDLKSIMRMSPVWIQSVIKRIINEIVV